MKWPWVRRSRLDLALSQRTAEAGQVIALKDALSTLTNAANQQGCDLAEAQAQLAAERALTRDLLAQLDLAQRPAAPDEVKLPDVVRSALDQRAPWRGNRKLRMALERDVRQMMRDEVQPEIVASMILDGERVE